MNGKKLTKEEFILRARELYGWKYDYSKVEYVNNKTKVCIICPEHGEFWQVPNSHLNGNECKKCANEKNGNSKKLTCEEFIKRAKEVHGDKYDYSKVEYKGMLEKTCIICQKHGAFWQKPSIHLRGVGCPECNPQKKLTTNEIIKRFIKVHGDKYDYSKVEYKNINTPVCIICPVHGEFWQTPHSHLKGSNCQKCAKKIENNKKCLTKEEFIQKARKVHGWKYGYSKVEYRGINEFVCIICPKHGEFWQTPHSHLKGHGCQKCRTSHLEKMVQNFLEKNKIKYIYQYYPEFLSKGKSHQSLDFYLPEYNFAIECQGAQHYSIVKSWGGEKGLENRIKLDENKLNECNKHGIKILYYSNRKYNNDVITTYKELKKILNLE